MRIFRLWLIDSRVMMGGLMALSSLLLLLTATGTQAQNACINPVAKGDFTLEKTKVCVGSPVKIVSVPASVTNVGYSYQYDGKGIPTTTTATNFIYTQPGSYTILQVGSGGGQATGTIACKEVTVLPLEPVKFTVKACSGRVATVTVTLDASTGQYDDFIINWGDGTNSNPISRADIVKPQTHTYNNTASYTIKITGRYAAPTGCETPATAVAANGQTITLAGATTQPVITKLTTVSDNSITLQYQAGTGASVQLYQKDVSGVYAPTDQKGSGSGTFTIATNAKQVQCFQVIAQDACASAGQKSDQVCSLVLDAKAANKQNNLSWQPYAGSTTPFRYYRVLRNGAPVGGTLTNKSTSSYTDNNKIECGTPYCYSLEATVGPTVVMSAPSCATGINGDVPGEFRNIVVSIENGRPRLVATLPTTGTSSSYTLVINRADSPSGSFQPVGTVTNKNTYIDETANPSAGSYCYQLTYLSNCGLSSPPSKPVCTVFLSSKSASGIDWTAESPFGPGTVASYTVEVIDSLNGTKREILVGGNTHYEPDPNDPNLQSQKYRIIATSASGSPSYSNFFTFRREARILVPDAFTPNGDGMNDEFLAKGIYVDQFRMNIYDRWGGVVYSTADKTKGWDGVINGQPALAGQYMYRIEVEDLTGQKTVRTGALLLIR